METLDIIAQMETLLVDEKIAPAFRHIDDVSTQALRKLVP